MALSRYIVYFVSLVLGACVTVNVYFPAAAAEKAADKIINDVYGKPKEKQSAPKSQDAEPPAPEPRSQYDVQPRAMGFIDRVFDIVIPAAYAAKKPNLKLKTPAITALRDAMKARHFRLIPHYVSGAVGILRDGSLAIHDNAAIASSERARVADLVAEENRDRRNLYKEIAKANGHPEWADDIQTTFAKAWVENASAGIWYQDAGGRWTQK